MGAAETGLIQHRSLGGKQVQGSELNRLKQELGHAHSQLQAQSQRERELLEEVACLKQRSAVSTAASLPSLCVCVCVCVCCRRAGDRQEMARLTAQCASQVELLLLPCLKLLLSLSLSLSLSLFPPQEQRLAQELATLTQQHSTELNEVCTA